MGRRISRRAVALGTAALTLLALGILLLLALNGIGRLSGSASALPTPLPTGALPLAGFTSASPTEVPVPPPMTPAAYPTLPPGAACTMVSSTQPIAQAVYAGLVAAFNGAGLTDANVGAYTVGDNCVFNNVVYGFTARETHFQMIIYPDEAAFADPLTRALMVERVLRIVAEVDDLPGVGAGTVMVSLVRGDTVYALTVQYAAAMQALADGYSGTALLDALGGWR